MKSKIFGKLLLTAIILSFFVQIVSAGVSYPLPTNLELLKGESGRFKFQIQNVGKPDTVICTATLGDSLLIVEFDEEEMVVAGGAVKSFYGTVTVPDDYSHSSVGFNPTSEEYTQTFCIQCKGESTTPGATIQIRSCDLPINVKVVDIRTKENMFVVPKPAPKPPTLLYAGIALLLVIIIHMIIKLKKKKKIKKKAKKTKK